MHGEKGFTNRISNCQYKFKINILLNGVYAVTTIINKNKYHGIANIGYKPTFNGNEYIFETELYSIFLMIYTARIRIDIVSKIRDTKI